MRCQAATGIVGSEVVSLCDADKHSVNGDDLTSVLSVVQGGAESLSSQSDQSDTVSLCLRYDL